MTIIWALLSENVSSSICGQRRPRSDCADAQSDQGIRCPLTESLDTKECMNGKQKPGLFCACAGWSESAHFTHVWRYFFAWHGPYTVRKNGIGGVARVQHLDPFLAATLTCIRLLQAVKRNNVCLYRSGMSRHGVLLATLTENKCWLFRTCP